MAKKKSQTAKSARTKERDKVTLNKIVDLADDVNSAAFKGRDISLAIPTRSRSNTIWNKRRGILQMGDAVVGRELFNLNQAKQFMQTMLHARTIKELIDAGKSSSLRGVFYKAKHTVAGTKENTFDTQDESDPILEDLEVALGSLRKSCTSSPTIAARWSETSPLSTMGMKSIAGGWAPAAMRFLPSSSPMLFNSKNVTPSSFSTWKKARSGTDLTKTAFGKTTSAF